jgi:hypothetical protein
MPRNQSYQYTRNLAGAKRKAEKILAAASSLSGFALHAASANGGRRLVLKPKHPKKVLYLAKLSSRESAEGVCPPVL